MIRFVHLSDLHLHRDDADNAEAYAVLDSIPDDYRVIVTGDITDDGHEEQYEKALKRLKRFEGRIYIAPGNHDFGAAGNFFSVERARRFDDVLMRGLSQNGTFAGVNKPVVNIIADAQDKVMVIALDSNLETEHPFDFACGEIGAPQLRALDAILSNRSVAGHTKIIMLHHHPLMHNNPFMELVDAKELWRTIHGRADVLAFGHKHESAMWRNCGGIRYVLACDNSPGKNFAREIAIDKGVVRVSDVPIGKQAGSRTAGQGAGGKASVRKGRGSARVSP